MQEKYEPLSPTWHWIKLGAYKYSQDDILGYGFESVVYKGIHISKKYEVAIKAVNTQNLQEGMNKIHFKNQIKCLETLKCTPNILNLLEKIQKNHTVYLVTQLCQGDLVDEIETGLTEEQAWVYMKQLVKGFIHLWKYNIIHRDIKPRNLFLNSKKQIKIGDFGFAVKEEELVKQKSYNVGSPAYMSPEAFKYNEYSHSSDVWAIGVIFYQMLTGELPWRSKTEQQLESRLNHRFITKFILSGKFSQKAKDLLARILMVDVEKRISGEELIDFFNQKKIEDSVKLKSTHHSSHDDEESTITQLSSPLWNFKKQKNKSKTGGGFNLTLKPMVHEPQAKITSPVKKNDTARRNSTENLKAFEYQSPLVSAKTKNKPIYSPVMKTKKQNPPRNIMIQPIKVKSNSQTNVNLVITYLLELIQDAFCFFELICAHHGQDKEMEHLPLLKVCYKNFIVRTTIEIINLKPSSKLVSQFCCLQEVKTYLNDSEYMDSREQCIILMEQLKTNQQICVYWDKAKQNNCLGLLNATISFLEVLKPLLTNQSKNKLKIGLCGAKISKKIAKYLSSSIKQVKQEASSPTFSTLTRPKVEMFIEEAIKSRKQLFD